MDTRKMLEFAYKARDIWEKAYLGDDKGQVESLRKLGDAGQINPRSSIYPDYGEIYEVINSLKDELAFKEAKKAGSNDEKKRTAAAKRFLKSNRLSVPALKGFKRTVGDSILLCNGYALFEGDAIIGIPETEQPERYLDASKCWPCADDLVCKTSLDMDDVSEIKDRLSEARAQTGMKKAVDMIKYSDKAVFVVNHEGTKSSYNSDYILVATELIGGNEWTVSCYGKNKGVVIEGKHGKMLIMPVHMAKEPTRTDKEAE